MKEKTNKFITLNAVALSSLTSKPQPSTVNTVGIDYTWQNKKCLGQTLESNWTRDEDILLTLT